MANVFIRDPALCWAVSDDVDPMKLSWEWTVPAIDPLDDTHARRLKIGFESGANDFIAGLHPVKIEVRERQASFVVFDDERECGGGDRRGDAESGGNAFDELSLAAAKVAGQSDHRSGCDVGSPVASESQRILGAI